MSKLYKTIVEIDQATSSFIEALNQVGWPNRVEELIPVRESLGRVTARGVFALNSSPHYVAAAMDGVAVKSEATRGASETSPIRLRAPDGFVRVNTGSVMPQGFDAVVKSEDVTWLSELEIELTNGVVPWQHVRGVGEDIISSELIIPARWKLRAWDLGALLAGGVTWVPVIRKPRVAIIPTGDELVRIDDGDAINELRPGTVIEYNSAVVAGLVRELGGEPDAWTPVADERHALREALMRAVGQYDIVIFNAGSSAGSRDYVPEIIAAEGKLLVHGVAMQPGKPLALGVVNGKPVIGLPGYPVSAALAFDLFVRPLLELYLGIQQAPRSRATARLARAIVSTIGVEEFVRVRVGEINGELVAVPLARGAGVITSLVKADGMVRVPASREGFDKGERVEVELLRPEAEIKNNLLIMGSHDLALDLLSNYLRLHNPLASISSASVGSLGGLVAVAEGITHLAGTHLLDEETGDYNVPFVKKLVGEGAVLVTLAHRQQGLIVPRGNPQGIRSLKDVVRLQAQFINRQRGSGTRVLLDYELKQDGISPQEIKGYEREELTHTGVATAVASGMADAGLGIMAAARALGLDFIPVVQERYELVMTKSTRELPKVQQLLQVLNSAEFKEALEALGGYDVSETGLEREA